MALPNSYGIDKKINSMEGLSAYENGGKGSGNFGHAGRDGKRGGSAPRGSGGSSSKKSKSDSEKKPKSLKQEQYEAEIRDLVDMRGLRGDTGRMKDVAKRFGKDVGEVEQDMDDLEAERQSKAKKAAPFKSEYKVGDEYTKGGVVFDVVEGENGPMGVSKDGKINTELPDKLRHDQTKLVEDLFDGLREEGVSMDSPRYRGAKDTYDRIQKRAIETARKGLEASRAPKMVREETERFLRKIESDGPKKSVEGYHKTATGAIDGWAKGNGGIDKPVGDTTKQEAKELVAELDSLFDRYKIMTTPKGFRK